MPDCCSATIRIGGTASAVALDALRDAFTGYGVDLDDALDEREPLFPHQGRYTGGTAATLDLSDDDQPWGKFADVEAICRRHGLPYVATHGRRAEWASVVRWWQPGMDTTEHGVVEYETEAQDGPTHVAHPVLAQLVATTDAAALPDALAALLAQHQPPALPPFVAPGDAPEDAPEDAAD